MNKVTKHCGDVSRQKKTKPNKKQEKRNYSIKPWDTNKLTKQIENLIILILQEGKKTRKDELLEDELRNENADLRKEERGSWLEVRIGK